MYPEHLRHVLPFELLLVLSGMPHALHPVSVQFGSCSSMVTMQYPLALVDAAKQFRLRLFALWVKYSGTLGLPFVVRAALVRFSNCHI